MKRKRLIYFPSMLKYLGNGEPQMVWAKINKNELMVGTYKNVRFKLCVFIFSRGGMDRFSERIELRH